MTKIKFLRAVELQDENRGTVNATRYDEGQEIQVSAASAEHWISRGKAVAVVYEPMKRKPGRPPKAKAESDA